MSVDGAQRTAQRNTHSIIACRPQPGCSCSSWVARVGDRPPRRASRCRACSPLWAAPRNGAAPPRRVRRPDRRAMRQRPAARQAYQFLGIRNHRGRCSRQAGGRDRRVRSPRSPLRNRRVCCAGGRRTTRSAIARSAQRNL